MLMQKAATAATQCLVGSARRSAFTSAASQNCEEQRACRDRLDTESFEQRRET
jgi:hypothetical protein